MRDLADKNMTGRTLLISSPHRQVTHRDRELRGATAIENANSGVAEDFDSSFP
jgi:hypothetical protein